MGNIDAAMLAAEIRQVRAARPATSANSANDLTKRSPVSNVRDGASVRVVTMATR
jgi:hypothetical protein